MQKRPSLSEHAFNEGPSGKEILQHEESLILFIDFLGGQSSRESRAEIYEKAMQDGLKIFAEGYLTANPSRMNLGQITEVYESSPGQNEMLLIFLRARIVLGNYYWDQETNYLKGPSAEVSDSEQEKLEMFVASRVGFEVDLTTPGNRILVLHALSDFLRDYPTMDEVPIDFVNRLMGNPRGNMITIDDGPNENTLEILNILDEMGITAIFYLIGENIPEYPDHVREIARRGHIIGYHTMEHTYGEESTIYDPTYLIQDFQTFQELIDETVGFHYPIVFLRAPGGRPTLRRSFLTCRRWHPESPLMGTTYLSKGSGKSRGDNWDVSDDAFRNEDWEITNPRKKIEFFSSHYLIDSNQVFLLHQDDHDVLTLQAMLTAEEITKKRPLSNKEKFKIPPSPEELPPSSTTEDNVNPSD